MRPRILNRKNSEAKSSVSPSSGAQPGYLGQFSKWFSRLFPLWTIMAAGAGAWRPSTFAFLSLPRFTACLAVLMLSMGIALTPDDFRRVLKRPGPVAVNFSACYLLMPALGLLLATALGLSRPLAAGCLLVGAINGGQSSNLCTFIAKGDVALSVLMTTATTVGAIFMTPLIARVMLGAIVPVDAVGIAYSTVEVILVPILVGCTANVCLPDVCRALVPLSPVVGVCCTVLLVGASVASCGEALLTAGLRLQLCVIGLHLGGGIGGYAMCRACGYDETIQRTTAIETSMKSSAFGFLLASLHFEEPLVRVPAAVSAVWVAVIGSSLAVYWSVAPVAEGIAARPAGQQDPSAPGDPASALGMGETGINNNSSSGKLVMTSPPPSPAEEHQWP